MFDFLKKAFSGNSSSNSSSRGRSRPTNSGNSSSKSSPTNSLVSSVKNTVQQVTGENSPMNRFVNQVRFGMNDRAKTEYDRLSKTVYSWDNMDEADRVQMARKPQMDAQLPHAYIDHPNTPAQVAHAKANPNYGKGGNNAALVGPVAIGGATELPLSDGGIPYGTGSDPFTEAANLALMGTKLGIDEQRRQFDLSREDAQPYMQAGQSALTQQQALLGLSGADAQEQAMGQFQESPGQKFLRERQERTLLRNASATGGLGGGNVRTALQEQAAGIAGQQFGDYQNRLAGLSGQGQTAVNAQGVLGANKAGQISNLYTQGGQARASGILGQQQAQAARNTQNNQMLMGALGGGLAGTGIFGPQLQQGVGGNFLTGALLGLL